MAASLVMHKAWRVQPTWGLLVRPEQQGSIINAPTTNTPAPSHMLVEFTPFPNTSHRPPHQAAKITPEPHHKPHHKYTLCIVTRLAAHCVAQHSVRSSACLPCCHTAAARVQGLLPVCKNNIHGRTQIAVRSDTPQPCVPHSPCPPPDVCAPTSPRVASSSSSRSKSTIT
jgi:hypothetical protein